MKLIVTIAALLSVFPAMAQTRQFYSADGSYVGQSMPSGLNSRAFYDGSGNYAGQAMRAGNKAMIYGSDGSYQGMITNGSQIFGQE